ncbi:MAG: hypothetical protein LCH46_07220 [Proteobacteria bacterium]|nr:hypothetical protein [Pseudomonadota bacterium]
MNHNHEPARGTTEWASQYLWQKHGLGYAVGTLENLRCRGGGPAFRKVNSRRVLYDADALDAWATSQLSKLVRSTSELAA